MATVAAVQRERKAALAKVKAQERLMDSTLEILERKLNRLRSKKKLIQIQDVQPLDGMWRDVMSRIKGFESSLADFMSIVST